MTKITLSDVSNPQNLTSLAATINANNQVLENFSNDTFTLDGTAPNQMLSNLDMNNNQILNLPSPATMNSPVRMIDVASNPTVTVPPVGTSGATVGLLNTNWTQSGNNTWTGSNTFSSITLPANSVGSGTITDNAVANNDLAQMSAFTIKGNNTGSTANAVDITQSQFMTMFGLYGNNGTTKTSNYTVLNADTGSTFILGGGAFFTVTFSAVGSYSGNFIVRLINTDTVRAKRIVLTGSITFNLFPGQSTVVTSCQGLWNYVDPGRWRTTSAVFFVDSVNGSDNNDGLATGVGGAFATISKGYAAIRDNLDCQGAYGQLTIAAGTYSESLIVFSQNTGANAFFINTPGTGSMVWQPAPGNNFCLQIGDNAEIVIQGSGVHFDCGNAANCTGIAMHQQSVLDLNCPTLWTNFSGGSLISTDNGNACVNLGANFTISTSLNQVIKAGPGANVLSSAINWNITGGFNCSTVIQGNGSGCSVVLNPGSSFTGSFASGTKFNMDFNSTLQLNGLTLPAPSAGVTAHGAQGA